MITHAELLEILDYDPDTGIFVWKRSRYNGLPKVGAEAGNYQADGYVRIQIKDDKFLAHRLAWFYMTGEWPKAVIDHIHGKSNAFRNLREATARQNIWNTAGRKNGTSKWKGVSYDPSPYRKQHWRISFRMPHGKQIIKRFHDEREAAEEYMFLALEHHGEFARLQ